MNEPISTNNYAQLITISAWENDASNIESHLRKTGLPVRMTWITPTEDFAEKLRSIKPDMVFFDSRLLDQVPDGVTVCTRTLPYTPLLLLSESIDSDTVTQALRQRARDVVSAERPDHLHAVYLRELGVCRLQQQLQESQQEVDALEERLESLVSSSEAAVVNVQEGIIVDANPRFNELFGYESSAGALGMPFMDQIHADSQKEVKKQISRCLKGRNQAGIISVSAQQVDGSVFKAEMEIKLVQFEGETAIELQIKSTEAAPVPEVVSAEPAAPEPVAATETQAPKPAEKKAKPRKSKTEEVDPRINFYRALENPKHYPPNSEGLSLGYFVVDNSAKIKQELGLANADQFLGRISTFLKKQIPGTNVYRLASDEFVLIAPGKLFKHGESLARNFCKQISEEIFDYAGKSVMMTVSIAINLIDESRNSGARFAEARDHARHLSAKGGNCIEICASAQAAAQTDDPIQWKELQDAMANNRIRLATRPIASLEGDTRQYYESYARIPDTSGNLVPVDNDGPQDTHSKLQVELDHRLIALSLGMLKQSKDSNQTSGAFIPISSCALEQADTTIEWLLAEHQKLVLGDQEIIFTLSEEVLMPHIHRLKELIRKLEGKPVKFAISDCAGNEQSLRLIQNLPGHFLRLTAQATRALCNPKDTKSEGLHEAVSIAKEHGYKIIAAATGDAHSMAVLWQLGVNYVEAGHIEEPAAA